MNLEVSSPHVHAVFYHPSSEDEGKEIFHDVTAELQYALADSKCVGTRDGFQFFLPTLTLEALLPGRSSLEDRLRE